MLPVICFFVAVWASSLAAPYGPHATVRVSFVSPPHSYSHGHDISPDKLTAASEVHGSIHDESFLQLYPYEQNARLTAIEPTESPDILEGPELEALIGRFSGSQPRFFDQFPHERSLLSNIQLRLSQNLPTLRTGSIRPGSAFYRI